MINSINKRISEFIKENEESGIVKQLKKANEAKDREAFTQLIVEIRETIWFQDRIANLEGDIEYHKMEIEETKRTIAEVKNQVKNGLNYHKIRRSNNE